MRGIAHMTAQIRKLRTVDELLGRMKAQQLSTLHVSILTYLLVRPNARNAEVCERFSPTNVTE